MIEQLNFAGLSKVEQAIERIKTFEPPDGYYLAFSGGKDSVVIKALVEMAGVQYDAHYNHTSVDPPELVRFIMSDHKNVAIEKPKDKDGNRITMWTLIQQKLMPPTRTARYCCEHLKEGGGTGRFVITGVRWAESVNRRNKRAGVEFNSRTKNGSFDDPDNPSGESMAKACPTKGKHILNPIIDWSNEEVWEFINKYGLSYCELYDEGFKRLGCIGCPMSGTKGMKRDFDRWPAFKKLYLKAFERMIIARNAIGKDLANKGNWGTAEDVMNWWIG